MPSVSVHSHRAALEPCSSGSNASLLANRSRWTGKSISIAAKWNFPGLLQVADGWWLSHTKMHD